MRVLVTGTTATSARSSRRMLAEAGHDVVGLDTQLLPRLRLRAGARAARDGRSRDVRDVTSDRARGLRRDRPSRGALERPARRPRPEPDRGDQRRRDAPAGARGARGRRAPVRLRLVVLDVRRLRDGRRAGRGRAAAAADRRTPSRRCAPRRASFALAGPDFAPVSMRNATVFGVSPRLRLDIVLNNLAAWAHTTGRIRLLSDGMAWRPLVHVRDVAKAALALLDAPEEQIRGEAFNVGSDEQNYLDPRARRGASRRSRAATSRSPRDRRPTQRSYRVDFSKLGRTFPGLTLDWDAERGARELVDAYRRVGLTRRTSTATGTFACAGSAAARRGRTRRRASLAHAGRRLGQPAGMCLSAVGEFGEPWPALHLPPITEARVW